MHRLKAIFIYLTNFNSAKIIFFRLRQRIFKVKCYYINIIYLFKHQTTQIKCKIKRRKGCTPNRRNKSAFIYALSNDNFRNIITCLNDINTFGKLYICRTIHCYGFNHLSLDIIYISTQTFCLTYNTYGSGY